MKRFAILALMMFSASAAHAVTGTATFNGLIAPTCILTAGTAGTLIPNADYTNLSSANAGGLESTVGAVATSALFGITTDAPTGISADTLTSSYSLTGATTAATQSGTTKTTLLAGASTVHVNMSATRTNSYFGAGNYIGTVTVRCE